MTCREVSESEGSSHCSHSAITASLSQFEFSKDEKCCLRVKACSRSCEDYNIGITLTLDYKFRKKNSINLLSEYVILDPGLYKYGKFSPETNIFLYIVYMDMSM